MEISTDELEVLLSVLQRCPLSLAEKIVIERVIKFLFTLVNAKQVTGESQ